jgi:hypothetical protein
MYNKKNQRRTFMTGFELINEAISHKPTGKVPYSIVLTGEAYDAYGDSLLEKYSNKQIMQDLHDGIISKWQAVSLAIGNHLLYV